MRVKLARTAGFCMGVRRAIEIVLTEANRNQGPIFTFGPLIHNRQVMDLLESKGVGVIEDTSRLGEGTLVIRAHGIPPQQRKILKASGMKLIDATCPHVARVQSLIRYHANKGFRAVIVGDVTHPEVIGLVGYGNGAVEVIKGPAEVDALPEADQLIVVAQTTQDAERYREAADRIKERFPHALIFETICDATLNRQAEVRSIASQVDGLVVVGGFHSGNTRRLVQVARGAGVPVFHVETDEALDKKSLSAMEVIGVTAGASTPNWMIKNVVQKIEAIQSRTESRFGRMIRDLLKTLFLSNIMVASGAFSLAYAATILMGREPDFLHPFLAFLYIYAMHVLNRFLDKGASTYNDPERARFYRRHRIWFFHTGIGAIVAALVLSFFLGSTVLLAMAGLSLLGMVYSIPVVPVSKRLIWRYSKIKDIPGSKTFSQALAWAALISLLPLLEPVAISWGPTLLSFFFVFAMVYVRSALFEIFELQGDLIVGRETLPIALGEKRTFLLLKGIILVGGLVLAVAPLVCSVCAFSYLLLPCFLSLTLTLLAYERRWLYPGTRLEAMVEGNLFLAGLLALCWHLLS
ncbi:MAG: 4-hydroxy-3-methylbut-2-enyl diphosphate reductase [Thermodesulfobacteriota bacterium]